MSLEGIKEGLEKYKRKYYFRRLSKGLLVTLTFFISLFICINVLESYFWFDSTTRLIFFVLLSIAFLLPFYTWVLVPLLELAKIKQGLSQEEMAHDIGRFFPEIDDKLLNLLELNKLGSHNHSLIEAAIRQKEENLSPIDFSSAINLRVNLKYLYIFSIIVMTLALLSFMNPIMITESTKRIVNFQKEYEKPAPFHFEIQNEQLVAYKNEDYKVNIGINGSEIPSEVYLHLQNSNRRIKLNQQTAGELSYTFVNVQEPLSFKLEGAGFYSREYQIKLAHRPEISDFSLSLDYPNYTKIQDETIKNSGNAIIPQGTVVTWKLQTMNTSQAYHFANDIKESFQSIDNQTFRLSKRVVSGGEYSLIIENEFGDNKTPITYSLDVLKDRSPEIEVDFQPDTVLFSSVLINGKVSDDYGFSKLSIYQKTIPDGKITSESIKLKRDLPEQNFIYEWDASKLPQSGAAELWVVVADNDAVNGAKETRSRTYYFNKPDKEEIEKIINENYSQTEDKISKTEKDSEKLNEQIQELEDRLRNKNEIGWQEEKMVNDILKRKEEIEKSIEELQAKHKELLASQNQFDKQSERIQEKSQQLQELMNELLDDETKKLYDELKKLLEEKKGSDQVGEQLSKIKPNEKNLEQELERALELFKHLKMEAKLESTTTELEELAEKQKELAEQSEKASKSEQEQIQQEQEQVRDEFEKIKEDIEEIEELNQELKQPEPLEDLSDEEQDIQEKLDELSEDLKKGPSKQSKMKQQNAGSKMEEMAGKMRSMQESMEMEAMQENMEQLQDILDNLIKLSFEQERIINDFNGVSQSDPRFLELSQDQLTLVENAQVVEDSLLSLAGRVVQISNFITREIGQINRSLDLALDAIKERHKNKATSHQQFAMTSLNNLALLLDDVLQNMQMAMAEAMGKPKPGDKKGGTPSMSQLQQQLSQQIKELKKSGKSGRPLSEELAKLAAEQARIREELEELQKKLDGQNGKEEKDGQGGNGGLKEAIEKMEQNEADLVNKRLTDNLIRRQEEIISRMLEAEKSIREQEKDPKREGETAKEITRKTPPAFKEYLKARKSEIELLNTIPLDLNPFYKKEVNEYFRRLSVQDK